MIKVVIKKELDILRSNYKKNRSLLERNLTSFLNIMPPTYIDVLIDYYKLPPKYTSVRDTYSKDWETEVLHSYATSNLIDEHIIAQMIIKGMDWFNYSLKESHGLESHGK